MLNKKKLGSIIYSIHKEDSFYGESSFCSTQFMYFSESKEGKLSEKYPDFIKSLKKTKIIRENIEDLICVLADYEYFGEGIFFTSKAIYVYSNYNSPKKIRVRYDDIVSMNYCSDSNEMKIEDYEGKKLSINTKLWKKKPIRNFLEIASENLNFSDSELEKIYNISIVNHKEKKIKDYIAGTIYSNISNASTLYGEDKFNTLRGHGFAAERANHLYDKLSGHKVSIVGDDNAKNGADRVVDGINIQSKYCETGSKCIQACFEKGEFRYLNSDGTPMKIEVPKDKYEDAVRAMENRIKRGEVNGVNDPAEAKNIVKEGKFTYTQVKNIAKAGTVESIKFDAANGAIIATSAFGISATVSFAISAWNGESLDIALKNATLSGLKVGGVSFVSSVLAGQLSKAGLNSILVGSTEAIIKVLGPKSSSVLVNAFRGGKNIYGAAAMKSAAKMLRTNIITGAASIVILSADDITQIFRGRISSEQLLKNIINTTAGVTGGTLGWVAGATMGATVGTVIPVIGNAIGALGGGLIGALGGGSLASKVSGNIMDNFIEDDAKEMMKIIEKEFINMVKEYLVTEREVDHIIDHLDECITGKNLKDMFASNNKADFGRKLIKPLVERELKKRNKIKDLDREIMQFGLKILLEDMDNSNEEFVLN